MSKANRIAFQRFLLSKGADLGEWGADGAVGNVTIGEAMRLFANKNAPAITDQELAASASKLGATRKQLAAFAKVESGRSAFFDSGRPKILWERHYFWRRLRIRIPGLSNPKPGGYTMDANRNRVNDSWEKLMRGCRRNPVAAFESCSWGKFQIMGAHWKHLGYSSVFEFAWSMVEGEAGHYEAFCRFIQKNGLAPKLRQISTDPADNIPLVRRYNGPAFRKNRYHIKIANEMRRA